MPRTAATGFQVNQVDPACSYMLVSKIKPRLGQHWGNWGNIGATLGQNWGNPHWGHTGATLGQQNRILSLPGANKKFGGSLRGSSVKIGTIYREKLGVTKLAKIRLSSHACAAMAQPEEGVTYPRNVDVEPGTLKVVWLEHAS